MKAYVLRQVDYGEADRICSLLTAERGRVEVRIPQARRSRKRFGGLDLFVLADVEFDPARRAPALSSARVLRDHEGIRGDVVRLALASYAAELLTQAAAEGQGAADLMRLAAAAFAALEHGAPGEGWARGFELKLLHVLGCRPSLRRCVATGEAPIPPLRWSVELGGVLGAGQLEPHATSIEPATVARLSEALHRPLSEQGDVSWTEAERRGARRAMTAFVGHHVSPRSKARRVLEALLPAVLLAGCMPESATEVRVQGFLWPDPRVDETMSAVEGAAGLVVDGVGSELGEASSPFSDYPGYYRFSALPPSEVVHFVFAADEHATTVVSGVTAPEDLFLDEGVFHVYRREAVLDWIAGWDSVLPRVGGPPRPDLDPDTGRQGGFVRGWTTASGWRLRVLDAEGAAHDAFYEGADGQPSLEAATTEEGGFAVFGLPAGPAMLQVQDGGWRDRRALWIVEDGLSSLPALNPASDPFTQEEP